MYIKKILTVIALLGLVVAAYFAYFVYNAMFKPNTIFNNDSAYIYIPTNASYDGVRNQLKPLLKDINKFDALAKQKKYVSHVKAGRYVIKKNMNNNDIINSIRSHNVPIKVSFNNQESIEKLAGRIGLQIEADSSSLVTAMLDESFLGKANFKKNTALGMYIPNSYEFFWNTSAEQFRDRMLKEYNRFWTDNRLQKAESLGLNPSQVIALASIVYEESKKPDEQPTIAGVYINRLKVGMPLQADPTIKFAAYQLPQYKDKVIRRVLNIHKDIDSPYNTYKYAGLPPGLIAMPDVSAIDAVLNYENHYYYYFAADAKRLGYHKFAKTLSQHNVNAREYQRFLSLQGIRQ
ncbi:MAG: endolytic transglycosylase MltG [Flavobacteriales bacterium]|nr:endolytic transglycosylase MltG [Flavobacteriia bacterium]NCP07023.1 endolytic transglycosylase MltG [Flavobacteriales bacterium]PIV93540.1 MAG: endolytic transglycosylase MltG [Flavobacteriaceae bacterium CG17_big_fil_post_rev_8_21_14_2_50_33_15]PIY09693.1 MAG: endolytic transglycosylase MltG [Flavobacteriaceae bacterium CG_4_10_14_3_um_filter_33_47]PJB16579.1 MAG: endolytic transglycosylase MltG [Flavobacteriaceae bacterium CG_4_9_14_3_um_filter_33_16]